MQPKSSVCLRDVKEAFSVKPRFPDRFKYFVLDVEDSEEQNLIRVFPVYVFQYHHFRVVDVYISSMHVYFSH